MGFNNTVKINKYIKKIHDPWGNAYYNQQGDIVRFQFLVGQGIYIRDSGGAIGNVNRHEYKLDRVSMLEHAGSKYVCSSKRSVERLRK